CGRGGADSRIRRPGRGRVQPPARRASRRLAADRRRAEDGGLHERGDRATTRLQPAHRGPQGRADPGRLASGGGDEIMSSTTRPDRTGPPLDVLDRIDRICDQFEAAWAAGEMPRIEDYVGQIADWHRADLFVALLAADFEARRRRGERPE